MMTLDDRDDNSELIYIPSLESHKDNDAPIGFCSSVVTASSMEMASDIRPFELKEIVKCDGNKEPNVVEERSSQIWIENHDTKVGEKDAVDILQCDDEVSKEVGDVDGRMNESTNASHKMCQTTFENPRRQSLLVLNLCRRLAEQEDANKRLRLEKDEQLQDITTNLMILESQLRREQERIARLLEEKDRKIAEQDKHIKALLRLNRRLAANRHRIVHNETGADDKSAVKKMARKQRRISWHNEVHVIVDYDKHWTKTNFRDCQVSRTLADKESRTENGDDRTEAVCLQNGNSESDDDDPTDFARAIDEACDAVNKVLQESGGDSVVASQQDKAVVEDESIGILDRGPVFLEHSPPPAHNAPNPSSLGDYNRVMSNHRSVTKPKDVKYKKISRVKSRSLQELRGRLRRHLTHPPVFLDEHILMESSEEVQ